MADRRKDRDGEASPREDLSEVLAARAARLDAARPDAVARRRAKGRGTPREGIAALLDPESFVELGGLARPARPDMEGAADGVVMGTGTVDGHPVAVMAYDYTVHAGTQSAINHPKTDRIFEIAARRRLPIVCWLEGGGARPHDMIVAKRGVTTTFVAFARLSGLVPTVGIVTGHAFAGNANLAGMTDCLIATRDATMGMAGPPLVEAALGEKLRPEEIGPAEVHVDSGVIDILVEGDAEAVAAAKQYLSYFHGRLAPGEAPDVRRLRDLVPESPRRAYDVRKVIAAIADRESVLELKAAYGRAAVTALAKIEGRPVGVIANQPMHMAGAIDAPASEKIARFISLCDAFDIPMLFLCDTPGLMVGPKVERTGLVRRSARILTALANATTPHMTVVLRKAYGLGYYVMGSLPKDPALLVAWPTAEFGGMGLEGAARIIWKKEFEAIEDEAERNAAIQEKTDYLMNQNTALEVGGRFEYDDVIDPADTR
ncbi:MAG: acyl-CoA carboxylase subunit beta, partial [Myxococcales bacterium]|nr:acyl-CoA carboxylase subunit beta [Myxococcales bacterium]